MVDTTKLSLDDLEILEEEYNSERKWYDPKLPPIE
jgi:hypothetical protein